MPNIPYCLKSLCTIVICLKVYLSRSWIQPGTSIQLWTKYSFVSTDLLICKINTEYYFFLLLFNQRIQISYCFELYKIGVSLSHAKTWKKYFWTLLLLRFFILIRSTTNFLTLSCLLHDESKGRLFFQFAQWLYFFFFTFYFLKFAFAGFQTSEDFSGKQQQQHLMSQL